MKSLDFEAQSTLSYALSNGILDLDRVHELCMASKREQVKALHPYSITPPSKDGERWRTNYTDRNGKRKTIRAQTEEALLDKLIPLYLDRENLDKKTLTRKPFRNCLRSGLHTRRRLPQAPTLFLGTGNTLRSISLLPSCIKFGF